MPAPAYIFVPNDGSFEKPLSSSEVKSFKQIDDQDAILQTRFSDLLHQRNINVPFWLSDKGVMILGSAQQAHAVSNIVEGLTNLAPGMYAHGEKRAIVADNDNKPHISAVFGDAAQGAKIDRPSAAFNVAAQDEMKARTFAPSRPSIHGRHALIAA